MNYGNLKDHVDVLVTLIGILSSLCGFLFWRILSRMEDKLDELYHLEISCRGSLLERFASRSENEKLHQELWNAIKYHSHNTDGRIIIGKEG